MIELKREMTDRTNLFACSSAWGWRSDGTLWIDGEKQELKDRSGVGLEPFGRGDTIQLVLDTDAGTLRFGRNGIMLERVISKIPSGVSFVVSGCNAGYTARDISPVYSCPPSLNLEMFITIERH